MTSYEVSSPEEMIALGRDVGTSVDPGTLIALCGQLGAGKTHFTKGLIAGLGGDPDSVTSPTFALVQEYHRPGQRLPMRHFDFYRMDQAEDVVRLGWDEYLDENDGLLVIEWADKFAELLPPETQWWTLKVLQGDHRQIERNLRDNTESSR